MKTLSILLSFLILCFFSINAQNQETDDYVIITTGESFGDIILNKSSVEDVLKKYGEKYKNKEKVWTEHFVGEGYVEVSSNTMLYKKINLIFYFVKQGDKHKNKLEEIIIKSPVKAKTAKGIILGQSTFKDVVDKYGNTFWTYSNKNKRVTKAYKGIKFSASYQKKVKHFDKKEFNEKYYEYVIDRITISMPMKK